MPDRLSYRSPYSGSQRRALTFRKLNHDLISVHHGLDTAPQYSHSRGLRQTGMRLHNGKKGVRMYNKAFKEHHSFQALKIPDIKW